VAFDPAAARNHPVTLLYGPEEGLRRRAYRDLMKLFEVAEDDLDVEMIMANERAPVEWVGAAGTIPFLAEFRIVVVRNLGRLSPGDIWEDIPVNKSHPAVAIFREVPPSGRLILLVDDETSENAQAKAITNGKAWAKLAAFAGGYVNEFTVDQKNPGPNFTQHAESLGKKLTPNACALLVEMLSGKVSIGLTELDKLAIYVGDSPEITADDIRASTNPEPEYKVFTMVDAIVEGKAAAALSELRTMVSHKAKIADEAFPRIFPVLGRQIRLLWQARICIEHNCQPAKPTPAALAFFTDKPNITQERDWLQRKLMTTARHLSFPQLAGLLAELLDADAKLKGARPAGLEVDILDLMVLRMVDICRQSSPALDRR